RSRMAGPTLCSRGLPTAGPVADDRAQYAVLGRDRTASGASSDQDRGGRAGQDPAHHRQGSPQRSWPVDRRTLVKRWRRIENLSRRHVLRGMLNGGLVTLGLPLLNCFLNENGTALASGAPMPLRFGTWFWGLGMDSQVFVPKTVGANWELPEELAALADIRPHINLFTNFNAMRDSSPNLCHYTGWIITRTGSAPIGPEDRPGETLDVTISRVIGRTTRFQSVTAAANGDVRSTFSYENANSINAAEISPVNFYKT